MKNFGQESAEMHSNAAAIITVIATTDVVLPVHRAWASAGTVHSPAGEISVISIPAFPDEKTDTRADRGAGPRPHSSQGGALTREARPRSPALSQGDSANFPLTASIMRCVMRCVTLQLHLKSLLCGGEKKGEGGYFVQKKLLINTSDHGRN